ncbi:MAG: Helix-turn-helix domain [Bacteroidetes bacterium]|jgi:transcriptional regulator with XRE-family HTH domain|nr:Helix-turn-helix domain [Bacteroidota bacterium]
MTEKQIEISRKNLLQAISDHMIANNITQEDAAEKSGFIQSNISRMLAGKFSPNLDNLIILCDAIGMKLEVKSILYKSKTDEG